MTLPMQPVKKPDGSYRLTIDYTALNAVTPKITPIVLIRQPFLMTFLQTIAILVQ